MRAKSHEGARIVVSELECNLKSENECDLSMQTPSVAVELVKDSGSGLRLTLTMRKSSIINRFYTG